MAARSTRGVIILSGNYLLEIGLVAVVPVVLLVYQQHQSSW
jgi:hypothetical protein